MDAVDELMTKIKHYFSIELTELNKIKLRGFVEEYESSVIKSIPKHPTLPVVETSLVYKTAWRAVRREKDIRKGVAQIAAQVEQSFNTDILSVAKQICKLHKITLDELKLKSPRDSYRLGGARKNVYVDARSDFSKLMFFKYNVSVTVIAQFMEYSDHSGVLHLLRGKKVNGARVAKIRNTKLKEVA